MCHNIAVRQNSSSGEFVRKGAQNPPHSCCAAALLRCCDAAPCPCASCAASPGSILAWIWLVKFCKCSPGMYRSGAAKKPKAAAGGGGPAVPSNPSPAAPASQKQKKTPLTKGAKKGPDPKKKGNHYTNPEVQSVLDVIAIVKPTGNSISRH